MCVFARRRGGGVASGGGGLKFRCCLRPRGVCLRLGFRAEACGRVCYTAHKQRAVTDGASWDTTGERRAGQCADRLGKPHNARACYVSSP